MKPLIGALLTGLMAFFVFRGFASDHSPAEIENAVAAWETAYADKPNREQLYSFYTEDAVLWGTSLRAPAQGHEAIRAYFARSSKGTVGTLKYERPMLIRIDGDSAVNSGIYIATREDPDRQTVQFPVRYTITYRKIGGDWKIIAHHSSRLPEKK